MSKPLDRYKRVPLMDPETLQMGDVLAFQVRPRAHRNYYVVIHVGLGIVYAMNPYAEWTRGAMLSFEYMRDSRPYWSHVLVPPLT